MLRPWKITLGRIDPALKTPLYLQIVRAIIHEIERGRLPPQAFLPSSRELATILGVNRKTVVLAYEDLIAQGWLMSDGTRGTVVAALITDLRKPPARPALPSGTSEPEYRFRAPPERPLALPGGTGLKLDEGAPDGRLFPADILSRAYRTAIQRASRDNRLQYRDPRGSPRLREAIAAMLRGERGLAVTPDDICITRGSQNSIYLAARTLLNPGDTVLVEALTYEPAVAAFTDLGAKVVPVGLDAFGADVEEIERACRAHRVRAIFLTPHHQFPTTVALRPERRLRVLELARQFGFAVIEDDYDHEFHFESQPLLPMASYAPDRVIYVGSLSKLLLPTLRIGYIAAPRSFIDAVAHGVSLTDGMGNTLTEDAAADLIDEGELRRHARRTTQIYAKRRSAFDHALSATFGAAATYRVPDGGLAFWVRFEEQGVLDRIEAAAPSHGLRLAHSASFVTRDDAPRGLRLGFASLTEAEAQRALTSLAAAGGIVAPA
ncbi:PLP-dependent aminotransferase family protein [Sphingomonas glacialis]|uniref:PLP-dependent aminotransferase family protein n=1 Tax=Sphingomonas glacialis TaxID=658225 RepID=A0A502FCP8_9SPHN|nr:PLP-dependent aminotransferase family protein [Sphingomonas glacialis]TPG47114.1 PLP-dependent aminotransferase family protein [Sphingomonas glacialis]